MRFVRLHPRAVALAIVLAGLVAAPLAYPMLVQLVARGFSTTVTYRELSEGTDRGDALIGVSGRGTFSGSVRGASAVAAYVAGKVTGVPYGALAKGGTFGVRYDIDAKNAYKGILVAVFRSPGLGSVCLGFSEKHGAFKAGDNFIPATGVVTIIGGMGQAARFRGGASFTQTDVTGDSIETFLGKGLLDVKIGSPRPLSKTCNAVKKLAG